MTSVLPSLSSLSCSSQGTQVSRFPGRTLQYSSSLYSLLQPAICTKQQANTSSSASVAPLSLPNQRLMQKIVIACISPLDSLSDTGKLFLGSQLRPCFMSHCPQQRLCNSCQSLMVYLHFGEYPYLRGGPHSLRRHTTPYYSEETENPGSPCPSSIGWVGLWSHAYYPSQGTWHQSL